MKLLNGKQPNNNQIAQVTLEIIAGFVVVFIIAVAITKIFVWTVNTMVRREQDFNDSRTIAASEDTEGKVDPVIVDEEDYGLDLFEEKYNSP